MRSALQLWPLLMFVTAIGGCVLAGPIAKAIHSSWIAARLPPSKRKLVAPPPAARTATLEITGGLQVAGVASLPEDFEPDMNRAPVWLRGASEIGVIGSRGGKAVMLAVSGAGFSRQKVLIENIGSGAGANLLDLAISHDGRLLATVSETPSIRRLDIDMADTANPKKWYAVARLDGEFDWAQLTWLADGNLALAAHAVARTDEPKDSVAAMPGSGLYLMTTGQHSSIRRLDGIKCPLSALAFSPNNTLAVAQGGDGILPALLDVRHQRCSRFPSIGSLQMIGWAPDSRTLLYRTSDRAGVFRFDLHSGRRSMIAVSSGAAGYASDGTIIALGSQELSWRRAAAQPQVVIMAQIALFDPHQNLTKINSLGFPTQPALLAQSKMVMSQDSNNAIIDTAIPGPAEPTREIIEYSYPDRAAFILAHGPVRGPIAISWSPDGKHIALLDADENRHTLSVITPPK